MQFFVRKLTLDDSTEVNSLSKQLGYNLDVMDTARQLEIILSKNDHTAFGAIPDSQAKGWIHAFQAHFLESLPFVEIGGLVVDEAFRGQGIGKALLNEVVRWSKERGVYRLRVRTQTKRLDAQQFYAGYGFTAIKEQKVYQMELVANDGGHQS